MRHMISAAALLAATAGAAQAQDACSYRSAPPMGSWAQYKTNRNGQDVTMRVAIVGLEKRNGKDAIWFETANESERGKMISEVLVPSYPFEPSDAIEMVMKRGDQPATKMSGAMMGMMRQGGAGRAGGGAPAGAPGQGRGGPGGRGGNQAIGWANECKTMTAVGAESVTVPAGTFKSMHFRNTADSTEVWVTREVPFGMVRSTGPRGTLELVATGKDAKKSITETPQEMSGM